MSRIDHYENFPVASWLCPARLRPAVAALYHFARTADDLADEGFDPAHHRLDALGEYRADLQQCLSRSGTAYVPSVRWPHVFTPLRQVVEQHQLPQAPLFDLLDAFEQDVVYTSVGQGYRNRAELLDYCRRSAEPIGRLLLHLYGVDDPAALARSDDICTALQLINFWQDLSVDIPRGRFYLPDDNCAAHGVDRSQLQALQPTPRTTALITEHARWARATMLEGAPLVHRLPGRIGWELRLVVQGGLRILDKVDALHGHSLCQRPRIRAWDAPVMLGRALVM